MAIICPFCGGENCDGREICSNCGCQLSKQLPGESGSEGKWVVRCPKCGKEYPVSGQDDRITECDFCEDEFDRMEIGNCIPERVVEHLSKVPSRKESYVCLKEIRSQTVVSVKNDEIIGREGTVARDFFAEHGAISGQHCRLYEKDGSWFLEHRSKTNSTILNHIKLVYGEPVVLHDGDKLILADVFFKVSICEEEKEPVSENPKGQWVIECPVCGKKYYGDSQDFRVAECNGSCSFDDFDKLEIASVLPRYSGG